jgi:hypothetical protein
MPGLTGLLSRFAEDAGHAFWPDNFSLLDRHTMDLSRMLNSSQVTYGYLLAVAFAHGG